ncbi:MAG: putative DNA-binding domain-containing protein [Methylococcaceae bacterium]|nr:putative DNA-binding domain-containing protein [Methylococcaceae bacterium]
MKNSLPSFDSKQREFAAYIRDPEHNPIPAGIQQQRMAMYRELFFNNISGFLASNFPVSPYFSEIPEEFLAFLEHERNNANDYPFMLELAHYEWVEMALSIAKEEPIINESTLTLETRIQLSPLAWPLAYQYPVHKISPDFLPKAPAEQPTCLIVYRDTHDEVHFMEITPLTYRLLAMIEEQESMIVADCLQRMIQETQHPNPELMMTAGLQILTELAEKMIIAVL